MPAAENLVEGDSLGFVFLLLPSLIIPLFFVVTVSPVPGCGPGPPDPGQGNPKGVPDEVVGDRRSARQV